MLLSPWPSWIEFYVRKSGMVHSESNCAMDWESLHAAQVSSCAQLVFWLMVTWLLSPLSQCNKHVTKLSPPYMTLIKNAWKFTFTSLFKLITIS